MPLVSGELSLTTDNRLILEELSYDRELLAKESQLLHGQLTDEQRSIYDAVISYVYSNKGGLYFVYGYGGTGKTFLWRALSAYIRAKGQIVINVASSGIASLLLPGGRTAHSRFAIPISINEESTCNIHQGSQLADLIVAAKLIIWDEAPMMHKHCFEALDRTMRDILRFVNQDSGHRTFGGKTVVFGGDFRQILPVVPKGSRQDIVSSAINSSYLWKHCKVMRLTKNLRLNSMQPGLDQQRMEEFANWLSSIGDGTIGEDNDGYAEVDIPSQMLLKCNGDPIATIVNSTFPQFNGGIIDGEGKTYFSSDTACKADGTSTVLADVHTPEFLNTIRASGLPNHALTLKVGSPIGEHVVEGSILAGPNAGTRVLIVRMTITPSDTRLPFKFNRRQFPLMLSYAMTINKSQGQTLSNVGLILRKPVFVHGQLYVAASRISQPNGLKILICNDSKSTLNSTTNVVYKEVFNNL
ncbi:ATP-dependent DNA helicase PIF1-like [Ipomoea triloba]|uniref:ATP-dependent DNA helicase PIF1-like n=1 Tax=Ipomoea triloba TaxID=35885 RepID=UPI00125D7556|nr:ATP-dependent DNA helicase PIF1-like [Ipomoea triloba]